jgi:hypothetical protein
VSMMMGYMAKSRGAKPFPGPSTSLDNKEQSKHTEYSRKRSRATWQRLAPGRDLDD